MPDSIKITITRDCAADGTGGTVADSVAAVMPDGLLDSILDTFDDRFPGRPAEVSQERWYAVCLRRIASQYREQYLTKQEIESAAAQAADANRADDAAVTVVEG